MSIALRLWRQEAIEPQELWRLRCAGRLLASREDPIREATRWVEHHRKYFTGRKSVIVLGVGCGYHLEILLQEPGVEKVVGIDVSDEVIAWNKTRLQNTAIDFYSIEDVLELKTFVACSYAVLKYFPSIVINQKIFQEQYEFLLGRTVAGAQFVAATREGFNKTDWRHADEPISIKSVLKITNDPYWKALGELIK